MIQKKIFSYALIIFVILIAASLKFRVVEAQGLQQQPTIAIPTVTGTPEGVTVTVPLDQDYVNVRSGPGVLYDIVGRLVASQKVAVLGRTSGGDWLLIEYFGGPDNQGWIYSDTVGAGISPGEVSIVEIPPTLTPKVTQTINATLAAQFITTPVPTRLPTYTPVDPLVVATYQDLTNSSILGGIPMGLVILILAGMGGLIALISIIRGR